LQGLSLVVSSYNGEDILVSFGGYNGRYNSEVKGGFDFSCGFSCSCCIFFFLILVVFVRFMFLNQATNLPCTTNATRDAESEFDAGQEGKIREIVMDNVESESVVCNLAINSFFGLY
jgi:hypothetical protein